MPPDKPELRLLHGWLDCRARTIMMLALVAVSLGCVLPEAQAQASATCVEDTRAALAADWPGAFGSGAIVAGPKTIATVERELRAERMLTDEYPEWEQFKRLVRPGDCLMFFRSNLHSWEHAFGSEGYVLVRGGNIVEFLATKFQ